MPTAATTDKDVILLGTVTDMADPMGDVGDTDICDVETRRVWARSPWFWPTPVQNVAEASIAARWLFQEAANEIEARPDHSPFAAKCYRELARKAVCLYYREGNTPASILRAVKGLIKGAPGVEMKVERLLGLLLQNAHGIPPMHLSTNRSVMAGAIDDYRAKLWKENAGYNLPMRAPTRPLAITAFMLLMREAKKEVPSNAAFWDRSYNEAVYTFRNSSVPFILNSAVAYTRPAPIAQGVAKDVYAASTGKVAPALPARKAAAKPRGGSAVTPEVETDYTQEEAGGWLAGIPPWAPWAAGGIAGAALLAILFRRRTS